MKTRIISALVVVALVTMATRSSAQNWTPAEKEVLQALETCAQVQKSENLDADMACYHDDFIGWSYGMPAPRDKSYLRARAPLDYAAQDLIAWSTQPLAIRIVGTVAVVHYYGYYLYRDKAGKDVGVRSRWTDVLVKQGGRWLWIADHGGSDPGTKPINPT